MWTWTLSLHSRASGRWLCPPPTPTPSHADSESALRIPQGLDDDSMKEQLVID